MSDIKCSVIIKHVKRKDGTVVPIRCQKQSRHSGRHVVKPS